MPDTGLPFAGAGPDPQIASGCFSAHPNDGASCVSISRIEKHKFRCHESCLIGEQQIATDSGVACG
jgi:hypothetical protein